MNLDRRIGIDDSEYLRQRYSQLNAFDINVLLLIDEIYVSKRVESTGGQVFGLTEDCEVAATALCFMMKSLSSGYRDMVEIFPARNLRAKTQIECFDEVMTLVHYVGFNVIGILVDNAPANRKFFMKFCNGTLDECVSNPINGGIFFLLFDPTHIIKNIYNNFLSRKNFELLFSPFVPIAIRAKFFDIETVYNNECQKPLRIAHQLTETVLNPKTIKKVNVKLAMAVLHESTVHVWRFRNPLCLSLAFLHK